MSRRKKESSNLKFAAFFFILVGALVFLSLIFRVALLIKESKFDGSSHFTILIQNSRAQVISFSPKSSTVGILTLENTSPKSLEIPIDAGIFSTSPVNNKNLVSSLSKMLFDFRPAPAGAKNQKEINFIDIFRLLLFSETVKENSISEKLITDKSDKSKIDSIVSTFFADPQVLDEKASIEIVNATDVYGLGNRLANLVSNMGGNVILVSTGESKNNSEIQYTRGGYTVEKLSSILGIRSVKTEKKGLPDVIIVIGNDNINTLKF